jgi:hypothetical protein
MAASKQEVCSRGHDFSITRKTHPNGDTYCSECKKLRTKKSTKQHPERHAKYMWKSRIKSMYGITENYYLNLYSNQDGKCAICKEAIELRSKRTHIDHDHETLEVRGLLCHYCNTAIGLFKENTQTMKNAISYLSEAGMKKRK